MSPGRVHLLIVHLPVVGLLGVLFLLLPAWFLRNEALRRAGYVFLIACAVASAVAYASGPGALLQLKESRVVDRDLADDHAVLGRALAAGLVLVSVVALNALVQVLQGSTPPRWQHLLVLIGVAALSYLAAWTAHTGGFLGHAELPPSPLPLFPRLP